MNESIMIGRLVRDPQSKNKNGKESVSFTIAVDRDFKRPGAQYADADFPYFIAQGQQAEFVKRYFKKGDMIRINGSYRQYKPEGSNESKHFFHVNRANFVPGARRKNDSIETSEAPPENQDYGNVPDLSDDDLPF